MFFEKLVDVVLSRLPEARPLCPVPGGPTGLDGLHEIVVDIPRDCHVGPARAAARHECAGKAPDEHHATEGSVSRAAAKSAHRENGKWQDQAACSARFFSIWLMASTTASKVSMVEACRAL